MLSALAGSGGGGPGHASGLLAAANFILSRMAEGRSHEEALAEAQSAGPTERDPAADAKGHDAAAKVMILSGVVFGRQLSREQVACRGITSTEAARAVSAGAG